MLGEGVASSPLGGLKSEHTAMPVGSPAPRPGPPSGSPEVLADMLKPWKGPALQGQLLVSYRSLECIYEVVFKEDCTQEFLLWRCFPSSLEGDLRRCTVSNYSTSSVRSLLPASSSVALRLFDSFLYPAKQHCKTRAYNNLVTFHLKNLQQMPSHKQKIAKHLFATVNHFNKLRNKKG